MNKITKEQKKDLIWLNIITILIYNSFPIWIISHVKDRNTKIQMIIIMVISTIILIATFNTFKIKQYKGDE